MRSFAKKNYFLIRAMEYLLVFPAFPRRKLIKLQTLTRIWSSIQHAHAHIFLNGGVIDLMAQELFKKRQQFASSAFLFQIQKGFQENNYGIRYFILLPIIISCICKSFLTNTLKYYFSLTYLEGLPSS